LSNYPAAKKKIFSLFVYRLNNIFSLHKSMQNKRSTKLLWSNRHF